MGRSRGGLTTKIHALVDANGNPIALKISEGQAHDGKSASDLLDAIGEGQILLGDCAYDSDDLRHRAAECGAWPTSSRRGTSHKRNAWCFVERPHNLIVTSALGTPRAGEPPRRLYPRSARVGRAGRLWRWRVMRPDFRVMPVAGFLRSRHAKNRRRAVLDRVAQRRHLRSHVTPPARSPVA
jgi:transposase